MKNGKCYFFFTGYYTVAAASELLKKYHIENRIVKAPVVAQNSCQFAVLVAAEDAGMAKYAFEREKKCINRIEYN